MSRKISDAKRAIAEDGKIKTHVGGQALIEGVMMRGRYNWAMAVREPNGDMFVMEEDLASGRNKNSWMYWPIIRGCRALVESLTLGYKALSIATEKAFPEDVKSKSGEGAYESSKSGTDWVTTISMIFGVILGIVLFIVAPALITNLVVGDYQDKTMLWNVVDGVIRLAIFVLYLWLIGRMSDVKRMFAYHGAEHKTIHCYEHGLELTPQNARSFTRLHIRCGTAFMLMVMIIAILVYTIIPIQWFVGQMGFSQGAVSMALILAIRVALMPLIAGISYEITVKWAGNRPENPIVQFILWPGLQLQYLTTNEPDDSQLECAIEAMKLVLKREQAQAHN